VVMHCQHCGRYFVPDRRVGTRQKACGRTICRYKRKGRAQKEWSDKNPDYFKGDYWRVKQWRQQKRETATKEIPPRVIQDKIPHTKRYQRLVLLIPVDKIRMIQDEIWLRRVDGYTFAADG